jgi:uncharacterized protein YdaU (DUF1376 family)
MRIPYIALYPAVFIADTYHLGNTELGIYWRLLLHYYQHLRPLPYDLEKICRIAYASSPEERKAVEFILTEFFTVAIDADGQRVWRHHRADEEIERAIERVEKRAKAARKSAAYGEKLKDPQWQKKRLEIFSRDNWECTRCQDKTSTLHIHHKQYIQGRDPWDYPDHLLVTLCKACHKQKHSIVLVSASGGGESWNG